MTFHRPSMEYKILSVLFVSLFIAPVPRAWAESPEGLGLAPPIIKGRWLRPAGAPRSEPIWGHADGLRVGIEPMPGPRGLLRVYAPSLGLPKDRVINYIAIEPILHGESRRSLSELEKSQTDGRRGKRLWSADSVDDLAFHRPDEPVRGRLELVDGVETLRVFLLVERFRNGAHVYLRLSFRADRPHEVGIATFACADSPPLQHCVVTATMGNYARLRRLHLANEVVVAGDLWTDYHGEGFAMPIRFPLAKLARTPEGHAIVEATPSELHPRAAEYAEGTRGNWKYPGEVATQSWRSENPDPELHALVNGRYVYWSSRAPIPGGLSYENFELISPFRQGVEFWFGVRKGLPDSLK